MLHLAGSPPAGAAAARVSVAPQEEGEAGWQDAGAHGLAACSRPLRRPARVEDGALVGPAPGPALPAQPALGREVAVRLGPAVRAPKAAARRNQQASALQL